MEDNLSTDSTKQTKYWTGNFPTMDLKTYINALPDKGPSPSSVSEEEEAIPKTMCVSSDDDFAEVKVPSTQLDSSVYHDTPFEQRPSRASNASNRSSSDAYAGIMQVYRISDKAVLPAAATPGSAGYDVCCMEDIVLAPNRLTCVPLGLKIIPPTGTYLRIAPRSGLAFKHWIDVFAGVVDPDYTGEVKVLLFNHSLEAVTLEAKRPIAQIIPERYAAGYVTEITKAQLEAYEQVSVRKEGGFGSTDAVSKDNESEQPSQQESQQESKHDSQLSGWEYQEDDLMTHCHNMETHKFPI